MVVKFKDYKQLNGETKRQISEVGQGILRRFDKTPFPIAETDVVCPHFMLLAWANGCMYNCAWCFLKGTFRFRGQKPNGRIPMIYKDRARITKDIEALLKLDIPPEIIDTGELSDSLMDEGSEPSRGSKPFSEYVMQYFKDTRHKVLFLTKSTNVANFLKHEWQKNAILAWSLNASAVSERWEMYAPTAKERIATAKQVYDAGYEVRFRIDPMVPIDNWKDDYNNLVRMIFDNLKPSRVTLGCLRGLTSTIVNCKDKSWVPYLTEKSNWGKKPPFAQRLEMYRYVKGLLGINGCEDVGICKDTLAMWKALGQEPTQIKCNCVW